MPGIFDDERRVSGAIWSNPGGTRSICPLDSVAKGLKWATLQRLSRLARGKMDRADTSSTIAHRP